MKIKVTDTRNGKEWIEENCNHSWEDLCLYIMESEKDFHLIYCDIEGLAKINGIWYMLDECSQWCYMPDYMKIEELGEENENRGL